MSRRRSVHLTEEQQAALEAKLDSRPQDQQLAKQNILESGKVAPSIQAAARKLHRSIISDNLNQALYDRPEPEELSAGIHPGNKVADRLAGVQRKLQHSMTTDKVGHLLEQRPTLDDLHRSDILPATTTAPSLRGAQKTLASNLSRSNLYHALQARPSIVELIQKGVYVPEDEEELQDLLDMYDDDEDDYEEDDDDYYEEETGPARPDLYYDEGYDQDEDEDVLPEQMPYGDSTDAALSATAQARAAAFHLTRLLFKAVTGLYRAEEITDDEKGYLKDLIVDQDEVVLSIAEAFMQDEDMNEFKESLLSLLADVDEQQY